jgi:acyl-CoA thioesterase
LKVHVEKKGRTLSSVTSQLHQKGKSIAFSIATFADNLIAPTFNDVIMPRVQRPEDIAMEERMIAGSPMFVPFRAKYDQRPAIGPKLGELSNKARVGGWTKFSDARQFDDLGLLAISDSWYPSLKGRSEEPFHTPTVDHTVHFLANPIDAECEFLLVMFETETAANGYLIEDGFIWSENGCLLARSRQLAIMLPKRDGDI